MTISPETFDTLSPYEQASRLWLAGTLISQGEDHSWVWENLDTPLLFILIGRGDTALANTLLRATPNGTTIANTISTAGVSALMWAARNGQVDAAALLLAFGAKVNYTAPNGDTAMTWAKTGASPLKLVTLLYAHGAVDENGDTAVSLAVKTLADAKLPPREAAALIEKLAANAGGEVEVLDQTIVIEMSLRFEDLPAGIRS